MSKVQDEHSADVARAALIDDIQAIQEVGRQLSAKAKSKLPWLVGGALGLLAVGVVFAVVSGPRRRVVWRIAIR